jgi:ankyrin repeat protein
MENDLPYDPFRGNHGVSLRQLLEDIFSDNIIEHFEEGEDPFSGEKALTVETQVWADEDRPLNKVARRGNTHCMKLLLEADADPHSKGDMGFTPLHEAVSAGHFETARMLLEAGARIDSINEFGDSELGLCSPDVWG